MVSTRGGARTAPDESQSLRKKPIRKAAAKSQTATTTAKAKAKTIRPSRKESASGDEDSSELKCEKSGQPTAAKPTRAAAARARKEDARKRESTENTTASKIATRTSRNTKPKVADLRSAEEVPVLKSTSQSRATRATRATAAKEKTQPLSPKKITQVSRASARGGRATNTKSLVVKSTQVPVPPQTRNNRKRAISNENEDSEAVEELHKEEQAGPEHGPRRSKRTKTLDENFVLSSRTTTPASSPKQPMSDEDSMSAEDDEILRADSEDSEALEDPEEDAGDTEMSHDELCGPKTPMKRSSPRQSVKYTSEQRSDRLRTPMRRFTVFDGQHKTPQSQQAASTTLVAASEQKPTTVTSVRDRAMAFPHLEPLPDLTDDEDLGSVSLVEKDVEEEYEPEQPEPEKPLYEFDFSEVEINTREVDGASGVQELEADQRPEDLDLVTPAADELPGLNYETTKLSHAFEDASKDECQKQKVCDHQSTSVEYDEACADIQSAASSDEDQESEESLITTCSRDNALSEEMQAQRSLSATPLPQTLVWDNLNKDTTVPVDFDSNLALAESLPQFDQTEILSIDAEKAENDTSMSLFAKVSTPAVESNLNTVSTFSTGPNRKSIVGARYSMDATVDFSEFIDVDAAPKLESSSVSNPGHTGELQFHSQAGTEIDQVSMLFDISAAVTTEIEDVKSDEEAGDIETKNETCATKPNTGLSSATFAKTFQDQTSLLRFPGMAGTPFDFSYTAVTPHYAISTVASRRKSLPAINSVVLAELGKRPNTSDGSPISVSSGSAAPGWLRRLTPRKMTPANSRRCVASSSTRKSDRRSTVLRTPTRRKSSRKCKTEGPKERHAGRHLCPTYQQLLATPLRKAAPTTTPSTLRKTPGERCPGLSARKAGGDCGEKLRLRTPNTVGNPSPQRSPCSQQRQSSTRKRKYEDYAKTAIAASRFRTPPAESSKRAATGRKPTTMRERALMASTSRRLTTPTKIQLKAPAVTPGQIPMTPHPAAPLKGVVALVEVFTNEGASASSNFIALLQRLGAKTTRVWSERLTHIVYKDGSPATLQRLRLHNKNVAATGFGSEIYCVNSRWVSDCDAEGKCKDESDEAYTVDVDDVPRAGKRRRKSMEPSALFNIGGNVVRDRTTSLGKSSLSRLSLKMAESPGRDGTPDTTIADENASAMDQWSPVTPAYLAAPSSLVQQTAPMHRVRKLDLKNDVAQEKNRRLTFWNGGS